MDPLSEVLTHLKPRTNFSGRFDIASQQAIRFPSYEGIKCYAIISGSCWLSVEKGSEPVLLEEGDCFLLPSGATFSLSTDPKRAPVNFHEFITALRSGRAGLHSGNIGCTLAGGHFLLRGGPADLLLGALPPVVHLRSEAEKDALRWSLDRMRFELQDEKLGSAFVVQQLAYLMLVQALRVHFAEAAGGGVGWLYALTNPQMKAAIQAMHSNPASDWTVNGLAEEVGMSRSLFALKFKETVGSTPMEYLTRWRMLLAGDRLLNTDEAILSIAISLGYDSESSFGKAFKRVMGCSPRQYARAIDTDRDISASSPLDELSPA